MVDLPMLPYQKCALNQIKITTENDTKMTSTEQFIQTVTGIILVGAKAPRRPTGVINWCDLYVIFGG
jgi:hypothetical protein